MPKGQRTCGADREGKQHSGRRFQYEALGPRIFATLGLKARRAVSHVRPQCALPERARAEHEDAGSDPDREGRARTLIPPSEPALGDDQNISWSHLDIRRYIAVFEKAIEVHGQLLGMIVHPAHDYSAVSGGKLGQSPRSNHDVQNRHPGPIGYGLRLYRLAHNPNLLGIWTHEFSDDDGNFRFFDKYRETLLDIFRQLRRCLLRSLHILQ